MLARPRQERILELLREAGGVRVADLTDRAHGVVTDDRLDRGARETLAEHVDELVIAPLEPKENGRR